jgi:hypothetical protein
VSQIAATTSGDSYLRQYGRGSFEDRHIVTVFGSRNRPEESSSAAADNDNLQN